MKFLARILAVAATAWFACALHGAAAQPVTTPIVVQGQIKCVASSVCNANIYTVPIGGSLALQGVDCFWPVGKVAFVYLAAYGILSAIPNLEVVIPFHPQSPASIYDGATFSLPMTYKSGQVVQMGVEGIAKVTVTCTIIGELTSSPPS